MVVSSLKTYIKKVCALSVSEFKIDDLFLISNDIIYSDDEKKDILNCIHKMKILDPACGSGAFPMGVLQRVFMIINRLDPENKYYRDSILNATANIYAKKEFNKIFEAKKFSYAYKLSILESMIYSVDIEPIAIEIARLRAFLSLVVEEEKDLNDSDNFGIKPLPNLEFQFIIANSLVGLSKDGGFGDFWASIFNAMIERIEKISEKYFEANTDEAKNFVKLNFEAFREEVKLTDIDDDLKNRLLSWNPFDNTSCDFFEPHIQFGIKDNFNIVLGNPAYGATISREHKKYFKEEYITTQTIKNVKKGMSLLVANGILTYITPNKWLSIGYAIKMREMYYKNLIGLCDCKNVKVFEAWNEPIIVIFSKSEENCFKVSTFKHNYQIESKINVIKNDFDNDSLGMCISGAFEILLKIKNVGDFVNKFIDCENPFSTNEAYNLIPLIKDDINCVNSYKLINTGTIDSYVSLRGLKLTTYLKSRYKYPCIDKTKFGKKFPKRIRQANSVKIIISGMRHFECFFDSDAEYIAGKSTIILLNPKQEYYYKYLLGILNSKLIRFYIYKNHIVH